MKTRLTPLYMLMVSSLVLASCSTQTTPPKPGGGGSATATSITYNTPELEAGIAMQGGTANAAQLLLDTDTQAVVNAAVTVTGPGLSLPLTFTTSSSGGGYYLAYYHSVIGWNYQANQNYTMTVSYGGMTFQSTVHSVGNIVFTPSGSNLNISWVGGGGYNSITGFQTVSPYGNYSKTTGVNSPYNLSSSSLPGYSAGSYDIQMNAEQMVISAFPGAYVGSFFSASDQESTTF